MSTINPTLPPPSSASRISSKTVESAVNALLKWRNSKSKTQKAQLLEQDDFLYLVLSLKKIPQKARTNPHKIPLPHPLISHEDDNAPETCLIIDDRPKSNLTKDEAMKKIKNDNIPISKVIKLTKLKTNYRPFEAKRKLCDSYDMFFADKRVIPLLPKLLGKQFFKKKKIPVPMDLKHKNWKEQMDKVCGSTLLYIKTGTCCVLKIGKVSMGPMEIVENVTAAIDGIAEIVPRKWGNIRSFHLKVLESLALPVYQSVPDMKLKIDGVKKDDEELFNRILGEGNVKDVKSDSNKKKSKKGRIHEVRYMDSNIGEVLDDDELGSGGVEADVVESEGNEDSENDQMDGGEVRSQKRKKGDKVKVEKPPKKMAKLKKEDGIEGMQDQKLTKKMSKVVKKEDGVKGRKDEDVVKQKKQEKEQLPLKEKKKSLLGKLKSSELKVKDKKEKKRWI
ncbi:hypothetical protein Q3G72_007732 [Acer saccharum]|nr:hypothetical protein Q3G72_007732 [Acer saccharum]